MSNDPCVVVGQRRRLDDHAADQAQRPDALPPSSAVDLALPFGTETSNAAGPVRSVTDAIIFLPTAHAPTVAPRR